MQNDEEDSMITYLDNVARPVSRFKAAVERQISKLTPKERKIMRLRFAGDTEVLTRLDILDEIETLGEFDE